MRGNSNLRERQETFSRFGLVVIRFGRWNRMNSEEALPGLWLVSSISRLVPHVWPHSSRMEALELSRRGSGHQQMENQDKKDTQDH